ncbi:MAG TPA: hypothetical protein VHZ26_05195 [Caulobacteraceae bacterium]|nr:hypothetical protein [Caulobacteraceae bacterium]
MQDQQLDSIDFYDVSKAYEAPVRDWFAGRLGASAIDGERSVHLPHPAGGGRILKLKGAGYSGGAVQFGTYHNTGPKAPVFDFDGRMMEDVAAGWDNAFEGGASFQQAATEHRVTRTIGDLGFDIVPCLGYGRITKNGLTSWFSIFDHEPGLRVDSSMLYPDSSIEEWKHLNTVIGELMFTLAVRHDLIGHFWFAATHNGRYLIRDVHPFRQAEPSNMSQVSWVMQVFYAMHLRGNAQRLRALVRKDPQEPRDLHTWQYRAFCPDVRLEDHDELRHELVAPYMLEPPKDFSFERLVALLERNRITAALMQACPPKFARVR